MNSILGIGNALVDALYPEADEQLLAELGLQKGAMHLIDDEQYKNISARMAGARRERTTGGSACNTIMALARLGVATGLIGKVSADDDGRFFTDSFTAAHVATRLLHDEHATGVASTFITSDGQRTFATHLGAAARLDAAEIRRDAFAGYSYLYVEGYLVQNHELIDTVVDAARAEGLKVCLDMASYNIVEADHDFFAHLLAKTDIVFANEEEARAFTGKTPEAALDELATICPIAVVKVGARGSMARSGSELAAVPPYGAGPVVDTTAAGDYFAAGFLHAQARQCSLEASLSEGALLASEVIKVVGTRLSDAQWDYILARLSPCEA